MNHQFIELWKRAPYVDAGRLPSFTLPDSSFHIRYLATAMLVFGPADNYR
jgi:hypothetical protein